MAKQLVKLNGRNLYDDLGQSSTYNCFFETLSVSGRGLAPTRDRQLQFPGDVGARDYGSLPDVRRITLNGTLHADTIQAFEYGLDQLKQLCRSRMKVDSILYGEAEAQTLWFADESVILGPLGYASRGNDGTNEYIVCQSSTANASARYQHANGDLFSYRLEFTSFDGTGPDWRGRLFDHVRADTPSATRAFYLESSVVNSAVSPNTPSVGTQFWVRDDRFYLVNYSGTMNEERLTRQWFAHGLANISLPFKAVYPFAVSEVKKTDFTPDSTNGYFKAINTGTAPTFPTYRIKGAANTPKIVEATHSLVWNANDATAKGILDEDVSATVSAAGFYGQTGKLNQAIAIDTNQDQNTFDKLMITGIGTRSGDGVGTYMNWNNGTVALWFKKNGSYSNVATGPASGQEHLFGSYSSPDQLRIYTQPTLNQITFSSNNRELDLSTTSLVAGAWYLAIGRWDHRRDGWSASDSSAKVKFQIFDTSGTQVVTAYTGSGTVATAMRGELAVGNFYYPYSGGSFSAPWPGLIDDLAIWDRPLSDSEVTSLVNGGTGVRADTVASSELTYYSDFDQTVGTAFTASQLASSNADYLRVSSTTTTTANCTQTYNYLDTTAAQGHAVSMFSDNDRAILYDETGYKKDIVINGTPTSPAYGSDPVITFDNGSGGAVSGADEVGVYATLNGSTEYFSAGTTTDLDLGTNNWTVSAWVNWSGVSTNKIFASYDGADGWFLTVNAGGTITFSLYFASTIYRVDSSTVIGSGKWHHIAATLDRASATGMKIYIDGAECSYSGTPSDPTTLSGDTITITATRYIGVDWNPVAEFLNGGIRDFRTYTSALSSTDILSLATNPLGTFGSPVNWWKMVDSASSTTLANDGSGGQSLALVGGTTTNYGTHSRTQLAYISRNLLADGGMENGGIGGWAMPWGVTGTKSKLTTASDVKKDAQAARMTQTSDSSWQHPTLQNASLGAGENYVFRTWFKSSGAYLGNYARLINLSPVEDHMIFNYPMGYPLPTSYTFMETAFKTASAGDYHLTSGMFNAGTWDWDDVKLLANLANDGGIESWVDASTPGSWNKSGSVSQITSGKHSGGNCARLHGTGGYISSDTITTVSGEWYEFSAWVRGTSGAGNAFLYLSNGTKVNVKDYTVASTSWQRISFIDQVNSTSAQIRVGGNTWANRDTGTGDVYVDDVALIHRPDLTATFNNMTTGYRYEPTRLTRGYKVGANERVSFSSLRFNQNEMSGRAVIRPQFPSIYGDSDRFFIFHIQDSGPSNVLDLYFDASSDKFACRTYNGSWYYAYSPVMTFNQDEEIEVGFSMDGTNLKVFVNGTNAGATNVAFTTLGADPTQLEIGRYSSTDSMQQGGLIIDDLEILAKSMPAEWFAEQHAKRVEAKNQNLIATYSSTLDAGDILTIDASASKVISRAKLWDASASAESDALTNMTINQSKMPILSPEKAMLYFPNSIPSGVEIFYRNNFQ